MRSYNKGHLTEPIAAPHLQGRRTDASAPMVRAKCGVTVAQPFIWRLEKTMQLHYLVDMILLGVRHELRS